MYWALFGIAFVASAQDPATEFVVDNVGIDRPSGVLSKLDADGTVHVSGAAAIPGSRVIALRRVGVPPHRPHDRPHVLLANGDCVPGRLVSIETEQAHFVADLGAPTGIKIPLSAISIVVMSPGLVAADARAFAERNRRHDTVRLSNCDTIAGTIHSLAANGPLRIDANGQPSTVSRERIDILSFNSELVRAPRPRGPYRRVTLRNGARLSLASASADATTLTGKTLFGESISIPVAELVVVSFIGGPAVNLSDMKSLRYEHMPYLGLNWPLALDRSAAGNDLRLGRGTFDNGLGLHSACKVTIPVPPKACRFESLVGLDDETGRRGAVSVDIRADGQSLLAKPLEINGRSDPQELRLQLPPSCKELTIFVDFGPGADVQDHVNFANARLVLNPS